MRRSPMHRFIVGLGTRRKIVSVAVSFRFGFVLK